jgi:hypothetical protein
MNRNISHSLLLIAFPLFLIAQPKQKELTASQKAKAEKKAANKAFVNKLIKQEEEGTLVYHKQNLFGLKLASDGFGAFWERGLMKTVEKTTTLMVEIGERKLNNEAKSGQNIQGGISFNNAYIYGKQNNFYMLKVGVGQATLLGGKGNKNGVAVSAVYAGGLSLGLLKPYYLKVSDNTGLKDIKYLDNKSRNDTLFLNPGSIVGGAGLFKGFKELKIKPGAFAKAGLRFDYGKYKELVSSVEAGIQLEVYASKMPIMIDTKPRRMFLQMYAAIEFGRRK